MELFGRVNASDPFVELERYFVERAYVVEV